ncbi:unnamed protein product [Porites lobata]|uniref:CHAT domain-containing protein n=1 Tax=Porites lobata TaxID=104759 RepID=A0ABN8MXQ8_9CNID|nr:unnamed protein product [Porites lobata]
MNSTEEVVLAIKIAIPVSSYLLNTNRVQKAIELCKENLFLFNHKTLENMKFTICFKTMAYLQMLAGYTLTNDYRNALEIGRKLLIISRETGQKALEGKVTFSLALLYRCQCDYNEAIELYTKALSIAIESKENELESICYLHLGGIFQSLGVYVKATEYSEKALAMAEKNGDRETEANCYVSLGCIRAHLSEYVKAKEYQEKALAIAENIGDMKTKALCYENLGLVFYYLCEYYKAKKYQEKGLAIAEESGDRQTEVACYGDLGGVFLILPVGEYVKAIECHEKALAIAEEIGDRKTKAACYRHLGVVFESLGEYVKAKEYQEKGLAIAKEIGDKHMEAQCYGCLGDIFQSLDEYVKAKEYHVKALAIVEKIGDRKLEAICYVNIGLFFESCRKSVQATEYYEKALAIAQNIGDKNIEAACYDHLGKVFRFLGESARAKDCLERALVLCREAGEMERETALHLFISLCMIEDDNLPEAESHFFACVKTGEVLRGFLKDHDQFKISLLDKLSGYYRAIGHGICRAGYSKEGLYAEEIGRARALADLMTVQYSIQNEISVEPQAWVGIERIVKKEHDWACLYISYREKIINLWVIKAHNQIFFQEMNVDNCFATKRTVSKVADFFCTEIFRETHCLAPEQCEDRSWFPSNVHSKQTHQPSQENGLKGCRPVEEDEDEQQPILTLADGYRMIIAPVADLLDKPEIVIVPDRLFFIVPFAALKDERGKYLSESFRIRIVPSLTTLKLIQDSPADYHSQTGALIVGDPEVGEVLYKGNLQHVSRLPFASEEAEMVGDLLDIQPLLGKKATKETILQSIHSVSLIHFAAHGDAERGEIVLAPPPLNDRKPQEEDYLLTMADISQIRLRAKLVVLSCCHSAQGQIKTEGVVGIARAFLGSGARSVLVALWAIQDEATKQFMGRFYEHLVRGESASESLHQAMKWMRENGFSDVEQWAPFMLVGDNVTLDFQKLRSVETYCF